MNGGELARVRAAIADLPPRLRGAAAIQAGRSIAAHVVLDRPESTPSREESNDWSTVSLRWILFASAHFLPVLIAGLSHLSGRDGRLEPEAAADSSLVSTIIAVAVSVIALRVMPRMPSPVRSGTRITLLIGCMVLPFGLVLGLLRLALGETDEVDVMVRAAVVQAIGAVSLFLLWRRARPRTAATADSALSDEECARLRRADPAAAQRMKDAEIQALLALTALGQVDQRLAERESARIDERWGAGLIDGSS
ncbi:hypothetical protein OVN20_04375 [Microcella daejeonensis]|uniref:hypothetical protein n=1 Tax=Microcella daejeonensis TaxID=2994971 RepID=UPI00226F9171|nr:hypothetical protein [Microcella daejeonensis]WAB84808.1 hypothetical protein OVN20_04375 [Microcella daejeonensis]